MLGPAPPGDLLAASAPDRIWDVETPQRQLPEQQPQHEASFPLDQKQGPWTVPDMATSLASKGLTAGPLSQISLYLEPSRLSGHPQHGYKGNKMLEETCSVSLSETRPRATSIDRMTEFSAKQHESWGCAATKALRILDGLPQILMPYD